MIATGIAHSVRELCRIAFERVGLDYERHVTVDPALFRPAEVDHLLGDATRARTELGWEPTVDFARADRDDGRRGRRAPRGAHAGARAEPAAPGAGREGPCHRRRRASSASGSRGTRRIRGISRSRRPPVRSSMSEITGAAVVLAVREARPEAVAHLAAIASRRRGRERSRPNRQGQHRSGDGGTSSEADACRLTTAIPVLVGQLVGGLRGDQGRQTARLVRAQPWSTDGDAYSRSKLAAEAGRPRGSSGRGRTGAVITRAFNHTGPGQGEQFLRDPGVRTTRRGGPCPAAGRTRSSLGMSTWSATSGTSAMSSSPIDSCSEFPSPTDRLASRRSSMSQRVAQVGSGPSSRSSVGSRGIEVRIRRDESLVRAGEPDRIVGDADRAPRCDGLAASSDTR